MRWFGPTGCGVSRRQRDIAENAPHESMSGNLPKGGPEAAAVQTRSLYAGPHRMTANRLVVLDLPEANAMRAPNEVSAFGLANGSPWR